VSESYLLQSTIPPTPASRTISRPPASTPDSTYDRGSTRSAADTRRRFDAEGVPVRAQQAHPVFAEEVAAFGDD